MHIKRFENINENINEKLDENYIEGVVNIDLDDIISVDLEGFLDILSKRLTGSPLLMDISYEVVGNDGNTLKIKVTGDNSMIDEKNEDEED